MASCDPFSCTFEGSAEELYKKIKTLVEQHGGTLSGDTVSGSFTVQVPAFGEVKGTYAISGQTVKIHITSKSFFLPCSTIQNFACSNIPSVEATVVSEF